MKKFFNTFLTAFAAVSAIPSFLILISWNALPGDRLYPVKTGLENIALGITIKTPIASAFSLSFTDRRFGEANRLLSKKGSTLGYTLLVAGARRTQTIIVDQKDTRKAQELITNIEEYQARIEEKKLAIAAAPTAILPPQEGSLTTLPTPTPTTQVHTPTPGPAVQTTAPVSDVNTPIPSATPAPSSDVVIQDLEETNQELEQIKEELKRDLPPAASDRARQNRGNHENDNPRKD